MAIRATVADVRILLDDSTATVDLFISQANIVVDELLAPGGSSSLSNERLALIETYIATHFATLVREKGAIQESQIGESKERYHNIYAAGFKATRYGQQAILFDTTGVLAKASDLVDNPGIRSALFTTVTSRLNP